MISQKPKWAATLRFDEKESPGKKHLFLWNAADGLWRTACGARGHEYLNISGGLRKNTGPCKTCLRVERTRNL